MSGNVCQFEDRLSSALSQAAIQQQAASSPSSGEVQASSHNSTGHSTPAHLLEPLPAGHSHSHPGQGAWTPEVSQPHAPFSRLSAAAGLAALARAICYRRKDLGL